MPKKNLRDHTTREIIAFSLLPFGLLTIQTLINTALNMYLTDVLGLTLAMTGVVLSATKVWDAGQRSNDGPDCRSDSYQARANAAPIFSGQ